MDWKARLRRVDRRYEAIKRERVETIVGAAKEGGLSRREIAAEVSVNHARVQQIIEKHAESVET